MIGEMVEIIGQKEARWFEGEYFGALGLGSQRENYKYLSY